MDKCQFKHEDCFAYGAYGKCSFLSDTKFKDDCPFYKTYGTRFSEHMKSVERLKSLGRWDLIEKFGREENQPRVWGEIVG